MAEAIRTWQAPSGVARASEPALVGVMGVVMEVFPEGVLWWADSRLLVVADLHLEKGSSFARRGQLLPPYDTVETLARLSRIVDRLRPAAVICLGDSFHDAQGAERLPEAARDTLRVLQSGREWYWVAGNHDPLAPASLGGMPVDELAIGALRFRHEPRLAGAEGEIAGHLHPCARVQGRGRSVRRRCFVGDGYRLILPAFGAYTGGLDVLDQAYDGLFARGTFRAFMLGEDRVYPVSRRALGAP
jgi:DNA ligase-associated metallophosphoesterase